MDIYIWLDVDTLGYRARKTELIDRRSAIRILLLAGSVSAVGFGGGHWLYTSIRSGQ